MLAGEVDPDLAEELVWTINRILVRGATILDEDARPVHVTPAMIGVACAQVAQVNAIREWLGSALAVPGQPGMLLPYNMQPIARKILKRHRWLLDHPAVGPARFPLLADWSARVRRLVART